VRVDEPAIKRRPAPVLSPHQVRDENVRVQLRIAAAARPMHERGRHQPVTTDGLGAAGAASCEGSRPLEVDERLRNGARVGVVDR
jgi:hypothetical protein